MEVAEAMRASALAGGGRLWLARRQVSGAARRTGGSGGRSSSSAARQRRLGRTCRNGVRGANTGSDIGGMGVGRMNGSAWRSVGHGRTGGSTGDGSGGTTSCGSLTESSSVWVLLQQLLYNAASGGGSKAAVATAAQQRRQARAWQHWRDGAGRAVTRLDLQPRAGTRAGVPRLHLREAVSPLLLKAHNVRAAQGSGKQLAGRAACTSSPPRAFRPHVYPQRV